MIYDELSIFDYIRSKAICKQWNSIYKLEHHRPPKPQAPWLMLPGDNNSTAKFFSIVEKKIYNIPCPEPMIRTRIYIGSCHGWLTTVDRLCNMYLLNPLTGAQIPLLTFRQDSPDADNDFTIMMIYGLWKNLAFARAGNKAWTSISSPYCYTDIIHHSARFYTINYQRIVEVWKLDELAIRHSIINSDLPSHIFLGCICTYDLVESLNNNLMLVYKFQNEWSPTDNPKNIMCMVFSLDELALKWTRVKSLHEQTLFLGKNQSMCLSTIDFPKLKQNCIYYTDDMLELCGSYKYTKRHIGIFYLEDEMIGPIDHLGHHLNWPPSVWLTPSLS
ncbi:F-box protein At2g05970-like [Musa acuminata AAA Group]|uniref:F-box protein At2g05970-like n=1 Tax=Musa acuminata AAA Group TaxID=214697 RepID=UPI0031E48AB3